MLRGGGAADMAPAVRLQRGPHGDAQALDLQPSPIDEPRGLHRGRLDDRGLAGLVREPLRHRDVFELAASGSGRRGGAPGRECEDEERGDRTLNAHARSLSGAPRRRKEIRAYGSRTRRAKSASTARATSVTCPGVRFSSRISTTIARPRLILRPTCIEAMLTFSRPRMEADSAHHARTILVGQDENVAFGSELDVEIAELDDPLLTVENCTSGDFPSIAGLGGDAHDALVAPSLRLPLDRQLDAALGGHQSAVYEVHRA